MALSTFAVDVDELGRGSIVVDGEDISERVAAVEFVVTPGQMSALVVHLRPGAAKIEGAGVVEVASESGGIVEWLSNLDAGELEQAVLNSFDGLDPPASVGDGWLRVLRQLAAGG